MRPQPQASGKRARAIKVGLHDTSLIKAPRMPNLYADIKEASWQRDVLETAATLGWVSFHNGDSRRSDTGIPDLLLLHTGQKRALWVELKTEEGTFVKGKWKGEGRNRHYCYGQEEVMDMMRECGVEVYAFRPHQIDQVLKVLQGES